MVLSVGIRQSFGLFMEPMSASGGWGRETLAFAIATQNLVWGVTQPFVGAFADKWGSGRVISVAGLLYALGLYFMSQAASPSDVLLSNGVMIGFALSGCGYSVVLAVISRSVSEKRRSLFLGIASTGGSSGQLVVIPLSEFFVSAYGWSTALLLLAVMSSLMVPLAAALTGKPHHRAGEGLEQTLGQALKEARAHSGFVLLTIGFFVCGWQIGFVAAHLPAFLSDNGMDSSIAAIALAVIGLFNIIGTFTAGMLGGRYRQKFLLGGIYFFRGLVILIFMLLPKTVPVVMLFAATVGFLWLATVPLTSGLVAHMFGTRYMATLYGIVFLSHQVGGFFGVWLGGLLFDRTGSYDLIWWGSVALGLGAGIMHVVLDDTRTPRLSAATA
jgi:predicted MFS family arabinose efflux permease